MESIKYIKEINPKDLPYLSKGLRTYLGYGLLDTNKIGLYHSLVGNWEAGLNLPSQENWNKIKELIRKSNKSYSELIDLGKENFGILIEDLAKELKMPTQIFLRYLIHRFCYVGSIKKIERIKAGKEDLSKRTKNKLLEIKEYIEKNSKTDPRRLILDLQTKSILENKKGLILKILFSDFINNQKKIFDILKIKYSNGYISNLFHNKNNVPNKVINKLEKNYPKLIEEINNKIKNKNSITHIQWERASKYNQIIDIHYRFEEFEEKIFKIIDKIGKNTVKNAIVSDKEFNYIGEVDVITKINNKTIIFLCKNSNYQKLLCEKRNITKKAWLLKKYINPEKIILTTSCDVKNKDYFIDNNLLVMDRKKIRFVNENPFKLTEILKERTKGKIESSIGEMKTGEEIKYILKKYKLSKYQLAELLNMRGGYLCKFIRTDQILEKTWKLNKNLREFLKIINRKSIRELNMLANQKIHLKKEEYILRYIRKKLEISINKVAKDLKTDYVNIGNLERGLVKRIKFKKKYIQYLKRFKRYKWFKKEGEKEFIKYENQWDSMLNSGKIINIIDSPPKGKKLEEFAERILKKEGFLVIKNVIMANQDLTFKREIDIYAQKGKREIVIECREGRMSTKWQDITQVLKDIKEEIPIKEVIYLSPHTTKLGKERLGEEGIIGLRPNELGIHIKNAI